MDVWVLSAALKGFGLDAPSEELAIAPVVEYLTTTAWKTITNKLAISSSADTLLKTQIFADVFPIKDHEYAAL